MHLQEVGDKWILIDGDRNEVAEFEDFGTGSKIIDAYRKLIAQGGFRGYDFLTGVLLGMNHTPCEHPIDTPHD